MKRIIFSLLATAVLSACATTDTRTLPITTPEKETVRLQAQANDLPRRDFYFDEVIDQTKQQTIGTSRLGIQNNIAETVIENGIESALTEFLKTSFPALPNQTPITMVVNRLSVWETVNSLSGEMAHAEGDFSFFRKQNDSLALVAETRTVALSRSFVDVTANHATNLKDVIIGAVTNFSNSNWREKPPTAFLSRAQLKSTASSPSPVFAPPLSTTENPKSELVKDERKKFGLGATASLVYLTGDLKFDPGFGGGLYFEFLTKGFSTDRLVIPISITIVPLSTPFGTSFFITGNGKTYSSDRWTYFSLDASYRFLFNERVDGELNPFFKHRLD